MPPSSFLEHITMTLYNKKDFADKIRLSILRSKSWAIQGSPVVDKVLMEKEGHVTTEAEKDLKTLGYWL